MSVYPLLTSDRSQMSDSLIWRQAPVSSCNGTVFQLALNKYFASYPIGRTTGLSASRYSSRYIRRLPNLLSIPGSSSPVEP